MPVMPAIPLIGTLDVNHRPVVVRLRANGTPVPSSPDPTQTHVVSGRGLTALAFWQRFRLAILCYHDY